ncbi:MAG: DNA polymerase Y family protein [Acidobacteriota bacterium]
MSAPWIACLDVPLFPLAARLRAEPELRDEAVAVLEGNGDRARVIAATRRARRARILPGLTLPQARARLPKLIARGRDPECERAAREALLEAAEGLSPAIEEEREGRVYLDVSGLDRLFSDDAGGERLGAALIQAAEAVGLPARVGIAASKLAARVAAASGPEPTVVPRGREAAFLAPLPLDRLAPEVALAEALERWGIRSIGELARLPVAEVRSRLGAAAGHLHAVARGRDPHPLVPRQPPPSFREGLTLEWPLVALEPFLFVGRAALERLAERLAERGFACRRLELSLVLEPDGHDERAFDLPAPTRDPKTLLTLLRLSLEEKPPGAPVQSFALIAAPDRPREAQLTLFGPEALSPDRLAATLARLFALLGTDRVGTPRIADRHRPEACALSPYEPPPPPREIRPPKNGMGLMGLRALRPPQPLEVLLGDGGIPLEVQPAPASDRAEQDNPRPRLQGSVRVAAGPWHLEEGWWTEEPIERDYWDLELDRGGIYRVYRERAGEGWFLDGVYD